MKREYVVKLLTFLVLFAPYLNAYENDGLLLQGQTGLAMPLSPPFLTDYSNTGVCFGGGIGVDVKKNITILFSYSNSTFNTERGYIPADHHAYAHQVLMSFMHFTRELCSIFDPFYRLSAGYTLLRSPDYYRESDYFHGMNIAENFIQRAVSKNGPTIGLGVGVSYPLSEESSRLLFELFSAACFLQPELYSMVGARLGIFFTIGS